MNLRQLNYFVAIGEAESITKAATRLRIAQPALTRHLKHLESQMGARLTQRSGRGIVLTDAGRQFLGRIKPLLKELRLAEAELMQANCTRPVDLSFGIPSCLAFLADRYIACAAAQAPVCTLRVVDGWSSFIADWLLSGRLDIGILYERTSSDPALELQPLAQEEHYLVGPAGDCVLAAPEVALSDVARLPLILPSRQHGLRLSAEALFDRVGCRVRPVMELDSVPTIKKLVERGSGYTILSQSEVMFNPAPMLAAARITGPTFLRTLHVAWRRDHPNHRGIIVACDALVGETGRILDGQDWGRRL